MQWRDQEKLVLFPGWSQRSMEKCSALGARWRGSPHHASLRLLVYTGENISFLLLVCKWWCSLQGAGPRSYCAGTKGQKAERIEFGAGDVVW